MRATGFLLAGASLDEGERACGVLRVMLVEFRELEADCRVVDAIFVCRQGLEIEKSARLVATSLRDVGANADARVSRAAGEGLYPGELATANQPLLTVMDISKLIAKAHIAQSEAASIKVGNSAELKVPGLDDPVKGRVTLVSPALDPGSTTIEVWVEASKPDPALRPGITVALSITAKSVQNAIVVPASAVFKSPEGADIVLLAGSDGHAHVKPVQIGVRALDRTQIVSGIKAGDAVITSGGYALPDNTAIKIEASAPAEKEGAGNGKAADSAKPAEKGKE